MIEVVSIKFKNRGKCYFFSPGNLTVKAGDKVIVETAKGLEIADCCRGNHPVMETAVVQPLRQVLSSWLYFFHTFIISVQKSQGFIYPSKNQSAGFLYNDATNNPKMQLPIILLSC